MAGLIAFDVAAVPNLIGGRQMNPEHIRQLAALLYQTFVETESVAMQGTPDWSDLPDLTRQRWVQMARLLSNRLEDAEIGIRPLLGMRP
jgi:hypothetical protein